MWLILPSKEKDELYKNENDEYNLLENDIIKLGQKKYEIIEININKEKSFEEENQINKVNKIESSKEEKKRHILKYQLKIIKVLKKDLII